MTRVFSRPGDSLPPLVGQANRPANRPLHRVDLAPQEYVTELLKWRILGRCLTMGAVEEDGRWDRAFPFDTGGPERSQVRKDVVGHAACLSGRGIARIGGESPRQQMPGIPVLLRASFQAGPGATFNVKAAKARLAGEDWARIDIVV